MNDDTLKQLYSDGVRRYKLLEFDTDDNRQWSQSASSGLQYRNEHFQWLANILNALQASGSDAGYTADKIIKGLRFDINPSDDWLADNPNSLTATAILSDTKTVLNELEQYLNGIGKISSPSPHTVIPMSISYDKHAKQINFKGYEPLSLRNTEHQALLCEFLFKSKRPVDTDVMLQKWGWSDELIYDNHKLKDSSRLVVYHAAKDLNEKINKHTRNGVKDLLLFTTKVTQINPDYSKIVS